VIVLSDVAHADLRAQLDYRAAATIRLEPAIDLQFSLFPSRS